MNITEELKKIEGRMKIITVSSSFLKKFKETSNEKELSRMRTNLKRIMREEGIVFAKYEIEEKYTYNGQTITGKKLEEIGIKKLEEKFKNELEKLTKRKEKLENHKNYFYIGKRKIFKKYQSKKENSQTQPDKKQNRKRRPSL